MSTVLFVLDVIAFVLVAVWIYRIERNGAALPGLFDMKPQDAAPKIRTRRPAWSRRTPATDRPDLPRARRAGRPAGRRNF